MAWIKQDKKGSELEKTQLEYRSNMRIWYEWYLCKKGDESTAKKAFSKAAVLLRDIVNKLYHDEEEADEVLVYQLEKEKRRIERFSKDRPIDQAIEDGVTQAIFADVRYSYLHCCCRDKIKKQKSELSYDTLTDYMVLNENKGWITENPEDMYIEQLTQEGY